MKIVVLNDGETYTSLTGCMIVDIPDNMTNPDDVDNFLREGNYDFVEVESLLRKVESLERLIPNDA